MTASAPAPEIRTAPRSAGATERAFQASRRGESAVTVVDVMGNILARRWFTRRRPKVYDATETDTFG